MTTKLRLWLAGLMLVAVLLVLCQSNATGALGKKKEVDVATKEIADELKKGNKDAARKLAEEATKNIEKIPDMMFLFKNRNKGGLGVGSMPLANPSKDGIDSMLRDLVGTKEVPGIAKQAAALEEMGYHIAAMGEFSMAAVGKAEIGGKDKTKENWLKASEEMRDFGVAFAKAATTKDPKTIRAAASKVYSSCSRCHSKFKD